MNSRIAASDHHRFASVRFASQRITFSVLCLSIVFLPVYLFSSGGLQISHVLVLILSFLLFVSRRLSLGIIQISLVVLAFYCFSRESFSVFFGGPVDGLMTSGFVFFSAISLAAFFSAIRSLEQAVPVYWSFSLASVIALLAVLAGGGGPFSTGLDGRSTGLFNNPNQLGYFSVCVFSICAVLFFSGAISKLKLWSLISLAACLAAASLSKAAILSLMSGVFFLCFLQSERKTGILVAFSAVAIILTGAFMLYQKGLMDEYSVIMRLQDIGKDTDDSFAERGYGAWSEASGTELVFGLGQEKTREVVGHEVHSTIFSFFVTYGMIGGLLFSAVMAQWFYRVWSFWHWSGLMVICMPPMLYGVTHNGSRFTIFWLLVALSFAISRLARIGSLNNPRGNSINNAR